MTFHNIKLVLKIFLCFFVTISAKKRIFIRDANQWKNQHVLTDSNAQNSHLDSFERNLDSIEKSNSQQGTFTTEENKFSQMSQDEFEKKYTCYKQDPNETKPTPNKLNVNSTLPSYVNWTEKGAVSHVIDQGECGSCWAIASSGSVEGQNYKKIQKLVDLSKQQLVDCSRDYGNFGCSGGLNTRAYKYIEAKGITTEGQYPYTGENQKCTYDETMRNVSISSYAMVESGNETQLQIAVATIGPISVAINANNEDFRSYKSGVYYALSCNHKFLTHAVLVVGYGHDTASGMDYWWVKNSWGKDWGENGYVRMARNKDNMCGIASEASYPII